MKMYRAALVLLAGSSKLFSVSTVRRTLKAIVNPGKAEDNLSDLTKKEDEFLKCVDIC